MIDVVEPFFKVLVDLGYDRSIKPWEPTAARLIPMHDPATVAADLLNAVGEGINKGLVLIASWGAFEASFEDVCRVVLARGPHVSDANEAYRAI